jgi:hypothetical protein
MKSCILLGILSAMLIGTGFAQNATTGDVNAFKQALEKDGFTVQKGELGFFDTIRLLDAGVLPSAYGNNPTTKYLGYFVPPAPGYKIDPLLSEQAKTLGKSGNNSPFWYLRPDEALVFVGRTPPECRFFNFEADLSTRTYGNKTLWIWANLGDPLNMDVIKTEGTPNGIQGNPFNQTTVVITTADKGIDQRIQAAAQSVGYSNSIINTIMLPSTILNMGLENNSDTFLTFIRPALFNDKQAGDEYLNHTPAIIFRITPNQTTKLDPYNVPEIRVRGTGKTEWNFMDDLEKLRMAILNKYNGSTARELPTSIWVPDGNDGMQRGINVLAPNNDCCYLWSANQSVSSQTPFLFNTSQYYPFLRDPAITLGNDTNEFIIVYGVNHVATGKATYQNFGIYGADVWNGIKAMTDADFNGTAQEYLPDNPNAKYLYVYKVARHCDGDKHCYEVPYGLKGHGIELDQPLFIGWRVYHEKATKTGPAYTEILYDRAIKFDPKKEQTAR